MGIAAFTSYNAHDKIVVPATTFGLWLSWPPVLGAWRASTTSCPRPGLVATISRSAEPGCALDLVQVLHRDSLGSEQVIRAGQVNLMTAGEGVTHSEEATGRYRGQLPGVQLWMVQSNTWLGDLHSTVDPRSRRTEVFSVREVSRQEVQDLMKQGVQLVDVLPTEEFQDDHLPGAINLPLRKIETEARRALDPSRPVVVYCWDSA